MPTALAQLTRPTRKSGATEEGDHRPPTVALTGTLEFPRYQHSMFSETCFPWRDACDWYGTTGILMKLRMEVRFFLARHVAPACHHSLLADLGELALREAACPGRQMGTMVCVRVAALARRSRAKAVVTGAWV